MISAPQYRIPTHIVFQEVDDELVLLDLNQGIYFGLKDVGKRFWELLAAKQDYSQIIAALLMEFEVSESQLTADMQALLADLTAHGLVVNGES